MTTTTMTDDDNTESTNSKEPREGMMSLEQVSAVVSEIIAHFEYRAGNVKWAALGFRLLGIEHFLMRHMTLDILQKALPVRFQGITLAEGASGAAWDWCGPSTVDGTVWGCKSVSWIFSDFLVYVAAVKLVCPPVKKLVRRVIRCNFDSEVKRNILRALIDHNSDPMHPGEELSRALRKVSRSTEGEDDK